MNNSYDLENIQQLLKDFYSLTGIKICIYDAAGNELCYYPEKFSGFCKLIRQDKDKLKKCLDCDKNAFIKCRSTKKQYTYVCHAGLTECFSPIIVDGCITGFIAIGQIKNEKALKNITDKKLLDEFNLLPDISKDKLASSMRILDACTGYEYLKSLVSSPVSAIDVRLKNYIEHNISIEISVRDTCTYFHISRNELYSIFREYFNTTPAEYIKHKRLEHAATLLATQSMPINAVAINCGIPDYNYFSKVFKRTYGLSPRAYRKKAFYGNS